MAGALWVKSIFNEAKTRLSSIAVSHLGTKNLPKNEQKQRFVWVRKSDLVGPPPNQGGNNPAVVAGLAATIEIEVRGTDDEDAEWMRQALISVLWSIAQSSDFEGCVISYGAADHEGNENSKWGYVIKQTIIVAAPMYEAVLARPIGDNKRETAIPETFQFDTTGEVDGDGLLVAPDH